jgi:hypothetical protein
MVSGLRDAATIEFVDPDIKKMMEGDARDTSGGDVDGN